MAAAAQVCKTLRVTVQALIAKVRSDVSGGAEGMPIPCTSPRFGCPVPSGYTYTACNVLASGDLPSQGSGCSCREQALLHACRDDCPCGAAYEGPSRQRRLKEGAWDGGPIFECGQACKGCVRRCANRVSQQPIDMAMQIEKSDKGWGARACAHIHRGQFVAQYAGELITSTEATSRLVAIDAAPGPTCHALLAVREYLPSRQASLRLTIDATRVGNIARFFNHSCDGGNLELFVVRAHGALIPHVALFARRDISPGEELTFAYGAPCAGAAFGSEAKELVQGSSHELTSSSSKTCMPMASKAPQACLCGSVACLGFMPNEAV
ncbi:hypothetical protein WJX84_003782 [Apatococcus fuscideae]|uniref:Uncharacterized protein n=1 Tax=Apatococcus fuscideae TaxID=2026836 RepID=A0AAW1SR67_9CHLO